MLWPVRVSSTGTCPGETQGDLLGAASSKQFLESVWTRS